MPIQAVATGATTYFAPGLTHRKNKVRTLILVDASGAPGAGLRGRPAVRLYSNELVSLDGLDATHLPVQTGPGPLEDG